MPRQLPEFEWTVLLPDSAPVITGTDMHADSYTCAGCETVLIENVEPEPDMAYPGVLFPTRIIEEEECPIELRQKTGFWSRGEGLVIACPNSDCQTLNAVSDILPKVRR